MKSTMTTTTTQFFVKFSTIFNRSAAFTAALALCLYTQVLQASDPEGAAASDALPVGRVTLVLGKAYLQAPGQARQRVQVGRIINVHDQIVTEANGHVHIRFVDKAYVSVRPHSRLEIVRYDYDPDRPELSLVKFNLLEGVTRSVSGNAAKSARQRFRLNTPIAAIGVRGTDFVVSVTASTTRALVNEGTIVVAPYSADCRADDFGPCTVNAVELTGMSLQFIELDGSTPLPRLLPASNIRDPDMMREEVELLVASVGDAAADKAAGNEVYLEGVTSVKVAVDAADAAQAASDLPSTPPASVDFTPATAVATDILTANQLVWGRFSNGYNEQERITLSFEQASAHREVTVGNLEYALFRPEIDSKRVAGGLGVVSFSLSSAQAFYDSSSGVVAMQVNGGKFDIDFQENRFATELYLNHDITGPVDFIASGLLYDGGYFHSSSDTQRIAGAVSLDGTEAGYFFERQLQDGSISGLTLWDSQ